METATDQFMSGMREAIAMWLALLAVLIVVFGALTRVSRRDLPRRDRSGKDPARAGGDRASTVAEGERPWPSAAEELTRYAEEIAVAAQRASVMAERRREEWLAAQRTQEAAWRAYEQAEQAVQRLTRADAFPTWLHPGDLEDRLRYLYRTAADAYNRGEISGEQLADALAHRNGWDPTRHPFEQQMMLRRMTRDRRLRAYREASEIERVAAHAADVAAASKRSLDDEAFHAEMRARRAQVTTSTASDARRHLIPAV